MLFLHVCHFDLLFSLIFVSFSLLFLLIFLVIFIFLISLFFFVPFLDFLFLVPFIFLISLFLFCLFLFCCSCFLAGSVDVIRLCPSFVMSSFQGATYQSQLLTHQQYRGDPRSTSGRTTLSGKTTTPWRGLRPLALTKTSLFFAVHRRRSRKCRGEPEMRTTQKSGRLSCVQALETSANSMFRLSLTTSSGRRPRCAPLTLWGHKLAGRYPNVI